MTQPAKSKTGMWVAIGGAALVLLLICCAAGVVAILFATRGDGGPGRPDSSPSARRSASPSASAAGSAIRSCVLGSWRYEHPGFTGSLHGSPSLTWKNDKGSSVLTFESGGRARIDDDLELAAKDGAGAEHRFKRIGSARFTYQITGNDITYGAVSSTGKSYYSVNGVQQGEPKNQDLWSPTPERIDCVKSVSVTVSGVSDGVPYQQVFARVSG